VASTRSGKSRRAVTESDLRRALAESWSRATSHDPAHWSGENAAWGQCAVSALVVQDLLGGYLLSGKINGIDHYWNRLSDEREFDVTHEQFEKIESFEGPILTDRAYVLSFPETRKRYRRLRKSVLSCLEISEKVSRVARAHEPSKLVSSAQELQQ
jgi:hypothetical protein